MQTEMKKVGAKGAPEPLALIQAVVNTRYGRTKVDDWKSPEQLREWVLDHQLLAQDVLVSQGDLRRMIDVREALRSLLRFNNGVSIPSEQRDTLNLLAKHAPLVVHFSADGRATLVPDIEGLDGVISMLLGIVFAAMENGTWTRLKACRNERCLKAFYDNSKNASGTWCAMSTCGSRIKARAYRQRKQEQSEQ